MYRRFIKPRRLGPWQNSRWPLSRNTSAQAAAAAPSTISEKTAAPPDYSTTDANPMAHAGYYNQLKPNSAEPGNPFYRAVSPLEEDTYDSTQRRAYRMSEVSSISSGFGDGDIIFPPPATVPKAAETRAPDTGEVSRFSWMSRGGRRDTVFTTTSEDRPARFRTINSWIDQQRGRVKRADTRARARGEVPVMPAIPGHINVTQQTTYR